MFAVFFLAALYLQRVLGYSAARGRVRVPARVIIWGAISLGYPPSS